MKEEKSSIKKIFHIISKVVSWIIFIILIIAATFLLYYYISTKIYAKKGVGFEPKFSIYIIISKSMTPNINVYDAVIDIKVKDPNDIKIGDVITFTSSSPLSAGLTVTHRVIGITKDEKGETCYQTKGDFNNVSDESCARFKNVNGKVIMKIPQLGRIQALIASKAGWLLFIMIPALIIIIRDILKFMNISTVKDKAAKISEKPKSNTEKIKAEQQRKTELKKKLLKETLEDDYYKSPKIQTIEKSNRKKSVELPKMNEKMDNDKRKYKKKKN